MVAASPSQIGFGAKTLILENGQSVIIDDDNYQQLKQSNQIVKENGSSVFSVDATEVETLVN